MVAISVTDSAGMMKTTPKIELRLGALLGILVVTSFIGSQQSQAQQSLPFTFPEQREIQVRSPEQLPAVALPDVAPPPTVTDPPVTQEQRISLDEAIRIAIENAEVVRVLTGFSASTSGRTIYDVATSNTAIDESHATFDPNVNVTTNLGKSDLPGAILNTAIPGESLIVGGSSDSLTTTVGLTKRAQNGAELGFKHQYDWFLLRTWCGSPRA